MYKTDFYFTETGQIGTPIINTMERNQVFWKNSISKRNTIFSKNGISNSGILKLPLGTA